MRKQKQDTTIDFNNLNISFINNGKYQFSKNNQQQLGLYAIVINDKIYIGESFDLENRWKEHIDDLIHNRHANKILQEEFNINKNFNNVYFIPIYCCAFIYATNMIYDEAYNASKLVLLILEHLLIKYFRNNNKWVCCNYENTINKIYRHCNKKDKLYITQCYNIILQILNNYDKDKLIDNILPYKINKSIIILILNSLNGRYDKNSNIINIINNIPILDLEEIKSNNIKDYYTMPPS